MRTSNTEKLFSFTLAIMIVIALVISGCGASKSTTTSGQSYPDISQPYPPVRTGDINTGTEVQEVSQTINSLGGMVAVSKTGDPLNGFVIDVPSNSYSGSTAFSVSSAPITSQTFGGDITPVSPMIYVDNGGTYSNDMMLIRVPVQVSAGDFAMGFYYDTTTKQLEGMPLISTDANSVTVGTRHFSDFFISEISDTLLNGDIDSGFIPGVDDWQFTNRGSYIAQGGHCEGQSLTALWYYCTQPAGADARLYGRYDNNGDVPATPDFWYDDSLGYRFASTVQEDIDSNSFANQMWDNLAGGKGFQRDENGNWQTVDIPGIGDEATWDLFAYSMEVTKEPQLVGLFSNAGGGHAMIVYRIYHGDLYVADPNYPGNTTRVIDYANGKFTPYNSGANADDIANGKGQPFETIEYCAKTTVLSWDDLAQRWSEFKDGTIGNDRFPGYQIICKDSKGQTQPLTDGYMSDSKYIWIGLQTNVQNIIFNVFLNGVPVQLTAPNTFQLQPGTNKLGIYLKYPIQKTDSNGKPYTVNKYIDFKYVTVYNSESSTTTTTKAVTTAEPGLLSALQSSKSVAVHINIAGTVNVSPSGVVNQTTRQLDGGADIVWNGTSFTGTATNGKDPVIHYTVNGTVSTDAGTLLSMTVTGQWTDSSGNSDQSSYTLTNMPIQWPEGFNPANFSQIWSEYTAADAGKYITGALDSSTGHDNTGAPFTASFTSPVTSDGRNQLRVVFDITAAEK